MAKKIEDKSPRIKPTGKKCSCGGTIVTRHIYGALTALPRYGNPSDWGWILDSKYCKKCKLKYD